MVADYTCLLFGNLVFNFKINCKIICKDIVIKNVHLLWNWGLCVMMLFIYEGWTLKIDRLVKLTKMYIFMMLVIRMRINHKCRKTKIWWKIEKYPLVTIKCFWISSIKKMTEKSGSKQSYTDEAQTFTKYIIIII